MTESTGRSDSGLTGPRSGLPQALSVLSTTVLGVTLIGAGLLKAPLPASFSDQILRLLDADPRSALGPVLAWGTILGEIAVGSLLLLRVRPRPFLVVALVLFLAFLGTILRAQALGERECGCFGEALQRSPAQALAEDAVLIGLTIVGLVTTGRAASRHLGSGTIVAGVLCAGALVLPHVAGPPEGEALLREGRYIGFLDPALAKEEILAVVLAPGDAPDATGIVDLIEDPSAPPVVLVSSESLKSEVPSVTLPASTFNGLELPITLVVYEGTVEKRWSGFPGPADLECDSLEGEDAELDLQELHDLNELDPNG